jgi:hypothetical protein
MLQGWIQPFSDRCTGEPFSPPQKKEWKWRTVYKTWLRRRRTENEHQSIWNQILPQNETILFSTCRVASRIRITFTRETSELVKRHMKTGSWRMRYRNQLSELLFVLARNAGIGWRQKNGSEKSVMDGKNVRPQTWAKQKDCVHNRRVPTARISKRFRPLHTETRSLKICWGVSYPEWSWHSVKTRGLWLPHAVQTSWKWQRLDIEMRQSAPSGPDRPSIWGVLSFFLVSWNIKELLGKESRPLVRLQQGYNDEISLCPNYGFINQHY